MKKVIITAIVPLFIHTLVNAQISISSTAFANNSSIPAKYSCEGENINPPLSISNLPAGTKSLALVVHDPDAPVKGGFTHWIMWNIKPETVISENYSGAEQGTNGTGKNGYIGMCPPSGTHHYHFIVYALDTRLNLNKSTNKADLEKAIQGHILAQEDLVGLYRKQKQ